MRISVDQYIRELLIDEFHDIHIEAEQIEYISLKSNCSPDNFV